MHYRTSYGQNVLNHSIEVAHIAGLLAAELGADVATAKRAGLLHDLGKAVDHEIEGSHVQIGVDLARQLQGERVGRPRHRTPTTATWSLRLSWPVWFRQPMPSPPPVPAHAVRTWRTISSVWKSWRRSPSSFNGVDNAYAIQAGREIRIMIKPEEVSEDEMIIMAHDIARKIEKELEYPGQIKVHLVREATAVEYAK